MGSNKVIQGVNDLFTLNPTLAKEWHPTKNGNLTPHDVTAKSGKKVWWLLHYFDNETNKHFDFEWESKIGHRYRGAGCPYLSGHSVWEGFNDLATKRPDIAAQWHPTKNGVLKPNDVNVYSSKEVWWYLPYDDIRSGKHFNFEWKALIVHRTSCERGCPYLSGRLVHVGYNDLGTLYPGIAAQWHPLKNGILTPKDVTYGTNKKVWWMLPYNVPEDYPIKHLRGKHFDFEWEAAIDNRTLNGAGCPFLIKSNPKTWRGFNDLATTHPELAKEWHPTKNGSLTPEMVTAGSNKKVWWYISDYNPITKKRYEYEWEAPIYYRGLYEGGCPYVSSSRGEKAVREALKSFKVIFKEQHVFKGRFFAQRNAPLKDDFAIFDALGQVVATIEYHGRQHYEPVDFAGKGDEWAKEQLSIVQNRDLAKTNFLKSHNIPQLIIPYWDFDKIEDIVKNFIEEIQSQNCLIAA